MTTPNTEFPGIPDVPQNVATDIAELAEQNSLMRQAMSQALAIAERLPPKVREFLLEEYRWLLNPPE
jgi:hypothetical protein